MTPLDIDSASAIKHILEHRPDRCMRIILPSQPSARLKELEGLARSKGVSVDKGSSLRAVIKGFEYTSFETMLSQVANKKRALILALDHLQDPQNLGAICRTAEGLGIDAVLLPKHRGVLITPGVYHASVGAVETLPIVLVTNLAESLRKLKDHQFWILGTHVDKDTQPIDGIPDYEKKALVLGAEWEGMSAGLEKVCDLSVTLPLKGKIESLNVSAAGAILMHELMKCEKPS